MMSQNKDTVTDFSPICPHCGEYVGAVDERKHVAAIMYYGELRLRCKKCANQFTINCALVWTTKKVKEK